MPNNLHNGILAPSFFQQEATRRVFSVSELTADIRRRA